jgi:sugar O-acyltransferase (sialic acid O-acetyltransferase NeuD family)
VSGPLYVFGAGGHGKVVADILIASGEQVAGFLDEVKPVGAIVMGLPVVGSFDKLSAGVRVALGVGENISRARVAALCHRASVEIVTAIHPRAVVSRTAQIGEGAVVMALAVVNADARVGRGAILNTCAVVEHDCVVGEFAHLSPNATMGGTCVVRAFAQLGIAATMLPNTEVGEYTTVGGGALVTRNVPSNVIAVGVPARVRAGVAHGSLITIKPDARSARMLPLDDVVWRRVLAETPHDVYQRPEYVRIDAAPDEQAMAIWIENAGFGLLIPIVRRPLAGGFDAITPYGYSGPLWCGGRAPAAPICADVATQLRELLVAEHIISLFVRMHPLINAATRSLEPMGTIVPHNETVAIDLEKGLDEIRTHMRQTHRNEIVQARAKGVTIEHDREWQHLEAFIELYDTTMQRVGAASSYVFPRRYFEELRAQLGVHLLLARYHNKIVAASVFFEENGIVQYHLSAMDRSASAVHPAKLLIAHAIEWAQARGNRWLHLGGGLGARVDGVFEFKAGFSPLRWRFRTLRVVADPVRYRELSGLDATESLRTDEWFFPLYRRGA